MIKYVFNLIGDPASTLKIWATSLNFFFSDYNTKNSDWQSWDVSPTFSASGFSSITVAYSNYAVINGACFYRLLISASTTATPVSNFAIKMPFQEKDGEVISGMGFRDPVLPAGSANNGAYVLTGYQGVGTIQRIDRSLFPASTSISMFLSGYYPIK